MLPRPCQRHCQSHSCTAGHRVPPPTPCQQLWCRQGQRLALRRKADLGRSDCTCRPRSVQGRRQAPARCLRRLVPIAQAAAGDKLTVAVTGATGLVGGRLVERLVQDGHSVRVLTRDVKRAKANLQSSRLDVFGPEAWADAVSGASGVVNLAGEPISTRWTSSIMREIKRSRIETTRKLVACINGCPREKRPKVLVTTSAVGFYGTSESQTFNEASSSGSDYLAEVCREWEGEARKAQVSRVAVLRTDLLNKSSVADSCDKGIVLAREGGALGKMLPVFNIFAGGPLGTGKQWCSWIHRDDLVSLYMEALQNPAFDGSYNATAPNPVRMAELCSVLGTNLGRPSWLPVPSFALTALLGAGASVVLEGQRVLPSRTLENGFRFQYDAIVPAIRNILATQ